MTSSSSEVCSDSKVDVFHRHIGEDQALRATTEVLSLLFEEHQLAQVLVVAIHFAARHVWGERFNKKLGIVFTEYFVTEVPQYRVYLI